eukprot:gene1196-10710_t
MNEENYLRKIENYVTSEFRQLKDTIYLDHAASTFFPNSNLQKIFQDWSNNLYSNPHSKSNISTETTLQIKKIRKEIKKFFNAEEYEVIFTHNASHSMKIIGESFKFQKDSKFISLFENHNSALGIREFAYKNGSEVSTVTEAEIEKNHEGVFKSSNENNLFVYPAECNSTGRKYSLDWILKILSIGNWKILLDASKFVSTNYLDLKKYPADFVAFSFYKIFGFPTGLGCLLIHKSSKNSLQKIHFSGGTVSVSVSNAHFHQNRENLHEIFEDGTVPFLNIISLKHVLSIPKELQISMNDISKHSYFLSSLMYEKLNSLKHFNGENICEFYGNHHLNDISKQGSILNLNFKDSNGNYIGYSHVEKLCSMENINIRTGCFCNPGACQNELNLTSDDILNNFKKGHVCWDDNDIIDNKPTGSIRLSFGYISTRKDVDEFLIFVKKYFIEFEEKKKILNDIDSKKSLKNIILYPIKSCQGMNVKEWKINEFGLEFDRDWTLIDENGKGIKLNQEPKLSLIYPVIKNGKLIVNSKGFESLEIELNFFPNQKNDLKICENKTKGLIYDDKINVWFQKVLNRKCSLIRKDPNVDRMSISKNKLNFSNEAQFLMISTKSMDDLNQRINKNDPNSNWLIERFRPNLVYEGENLISFEEDNYEKVSIGKVNFEVNGRCNRCSMICVDSETLNQTYEPLRTLARFRREKGRILFGILMNTKDFNSKIKVRDDITILK